MYVPKSALTSTVAGGRRWDAARRLLALGLDGAGARLSFLLEDEDGDKEVNNGNGDGVDRERFI